MDINFLVRISCMTFNHAPYIEDAMNGFCMQETSFPFVCTIIDDASTDGEPVVIKNYLHQHFDLHNKDVVRNEETNDYTMTFAQHKSNKNCFFAVFYLKYNHYSIKKSKIPYVQEWQEQVKYIAICEGDDYWIAPEKLQRQKELLEKNPNCTMTCNRTRLFSEKRKKYIGENYCYNKSQIVNTKDIIYRTGLFISTCSIVYRKKLTDEIPDYWKKCKVGDYPLQIMCAMKGYVYYSNDIMSVYRVENTNSWIGTIHWGKMDIKTVETIKSLVEMFKGFAKDYPRYETMFKDKIADQINKRIPWWHSPQNDITWYLDFFSDDIKDYSLRWKMDLWIRRVKIPKIRSWYTKYIMRKYSPQNLLY